MIVTTGFDHIVLNVTDVERSAGWYVETLGMTRSEIRPSDGGGPRTTLHFGTQKINLRPVATDPADWFTGKNPAAGSDDFCVLTLSSPDEVVAHLGALDIAVEGGPIERTGARGTMTSVYCRDPDGNLVEIASY